jgi:hypothetical protein
MATTPFITLALTLFLVACGPPPSRTGITPHPEFWEYTLPPSRNEPGGFASRPAPLREPLPATPGPRPDRTP